MKSQSPPKSTSMKSSEQAAAYSRKAPTKVAARYSPVWVLQHYGDAPTYSLHLIERIRSGVHKTEWKQFIATIGATEKEFEHILPSSISSMQKKSVYDPDTSERIYELATLFSLGFEVFDTPAAFKAWLHTPSRPLGNVAPFDLLDSSLGFDLVRTEIHRIHLNVYV